MRVLLVADPSMIAFSTYLASVARSLADRGHEIHILRCGASVAHDERSGSITTHYRRRPRLRAVSRLGRVPVLGRRMRRLLDGRDARFSGPFRRLALAYANYREYRRLGVDVDVIEVPEHQAEGLFFAMLCPKPLVVELHGPVGVVTRYWGIPPDLRLRISTVLERWTASRATLTVVPSQLARKELEAAGWNVAATSRLVPHTVAPERYASVSSASTTGRVVLAVGEVGELKGSDVLLEAVSRLPSGCDAEVVFVGPSARRRDGSTVMDELAASAQRLGVRAVFTGFVDHRHLVGWYERARVVVVASRFETFSQVGLEALAAARPVVCTDRTGLSEIAARANRAITVVPSGQPVPLARALVPFLEDAEHAARIGARGRRFVCRHTRRVALERERVYSEAMRRRRVSNARDQAV